MLRLLTWNVGKKAAQKRCNIRSEIEKYKPHIVALQEVPLEMGTADYSTFLNKRLYDKILIATLIDVQRQKQQVLSNKPGILHVLDDKQIKVYVSFPMHKSMIIAIRRPAELEEELGLIDLNSLAVRLRYGRQRFDVINSHIHHGCNMRAESVKLGKLKMIQRIKDDVLSRNDPPKVWCGDFNSALTPCSKVPARQPTLPAEESKTGSSCRYSGSNLISDVFHQGYCKPFRLPSAQGMKYDYTHYQMQNAEPVNRYETRTGRY